MLISPDRTPVVLFGVGGHAAVVADILQRSGHSVVATVAPSGGIENVVNFDDDAAGIEHARDGGAAAFVAIGDNAIRTRVLTAAQAAGVTVVHVVDPTATVAGVVGAGTSVHQHAHVGVGAVVGSGCIVNTGAVVEHGVTLGNGVHVAPGAVIAGGVEIASGTLIGAGATVAPAVTIGANVTVGAGAVVVDDIADGATAVGVPARPRSRR